MNGKSCSVRIRLLIGFGMFFLLFSGVANGFDIFLEPANVQRNQGEKVRIHIYANPASNLISMGVKVTFDSAVLQVAVAEKNTDFASGFVMDADGDEATTGDQYTTPDVEIDNSAGTVIIIGGRLMGSATNGLSGKVLLGWIVFDAIGTGNSSLNVDLAKYHPNDPTETFDNFVQLDGTVDEPANVPGDLGSVCVLTSGACTADVNDNGYTDAVDFSMLRVAMGKGFPDPVYNVKCDFNANGYVDSVDFAIMRSMMGKPCPSCP